MDAPGAPALFVPASSIGTAMSGPGTTRTSFQQPSVYELIRWTLLQQTLRPPDRDGPDTDLLCAPPGSRAYVENQHHQRLGAKSGDRWSRRTEAAQASLGPAMAACRWAPASPCVRGCPRRGNPPLASLLTRCLRFSALAAAICTRSRGQKSQIDRGFWKWDTLQVRSADGPAELAGGGRPQPQCLARLRCRASSTHGFAF